MSIFDFFYPKRCAGCGKLGTYFCPRCILSAKLHFPQVCPVCERNSVDGVTHRWCRRKVSPNGLTAIWAYEGAPRKLISKLKYKFVKEMALSLSSAAAGMLKIMQRSNPYSPAWARDEMVLVPIPLHWTRHNWRGFNHVEEVGRLLAEMMDWQLLPLLVRKKSSKPQVGLKEKEREKNVAGIFEINPSYIPYVLSPNSLALVLFDDVWTTGATMREAARVLKEAGAKKVWCLTLAR